jgi:hypothetical protein
VASVVVVTALVDVVVAIAFERVAPFDNEMDAKLACPGGLTAFLLPAGALSGLEAAIPNARLAPGRWRHCPLLRWAIFNWRIVVVCVVEGYAALKPFSCGEGQGL